jgi:murein L,D-transpeptidase YafK
MHRRSRLLSMGWAMLFFLRHLKRCLFGLCAVIVTIGNAQAATILAPDLPAGAVDRSERKRLAAEGKVLPGTPDLANLDERLATHHVTRDASIMIRIFKAESELEVWMTDNTGEYALFATYPVCFWSGTLGPKLKEGDRQAPEGFYTVTLPQAYREGARWVVGLDLGFPNAFDKLNARSGSAILVHGGCASIGCFAVTNPVNDEINKLVLRSIGAGQAYVPIHVFPFRMTSENFNRYDIPQWRDFWRNLKEGYDLFEQTHRPPRVSVCNISYVFDPASRIEAANPAPISVCPTTEAMLQTPDNLNSSVAAQTPPSTKMAYPSPAKVSDPTPPLHCSPTLASCRKYAALSDKRAKKQAVAAEEKKLGGNRSSGHKSQRHTASRSNYSSRETE